MKAEKILKEQQKERVNWTNKILKEFSDWQRTKDCVIMPTSQAMPDRPDFLQLGYVVYKRDEIINKETKEDKKEETKK